MSESNKNDTSSVPTEPIVNVTTTIIPSTESFKPKTQEERVQELLDLIHEIRRKRLLEKAEMDKAVEELVKAQQEARKKLVVAETKIEIEKYKAIIISLGAEKQLVSERRYLSKSLYLEQGELEAELAKLRSSAK